MTVYGVDDILDDQFFTSEVKYPWLEYPSDRYSDAQRVYAGVVASRYARGIMDYSLHAHEYEAAYRRTKNNDRVPSHYQLAMRLGDWTIARDTIAPFGDKKLGMTRAQAYTPTLIADVLYAVARCVRKSDVRKVTKDDYELFIQLTGIELPTVGTLTRRVAGSDVWGKMIFDLEPIFTYRELIDSGELSLPTDEDEYQSSLEVVKEKVEEKRNARYQL